MNKCMNDYLVISTVCKSRSMAISY